MPSLEMVEKLRQMANVSYDEARAALEACGDDLLEAVIYLERMGKTAPNGGYYCSKMTTTPYAAGERPQPPKGESFSQLIHRFLRWCGKILHKGNTNTFEVQKGEQRIMSVPVTVLVLLAVFCFWVTLPLLIVGLFCGFRYRFQGPELEGTGVNDVMDTVAATAEQVKSEVVGSVEQHRNEHKKPHSTENP